MSCSLGCFSQLLKHQIELPHHHQWQASSSRGRSHAIMSHNKKAHIPTFKENIPIDLVSESILQDFRISLSEEYSPILSTSPDISTTHFLQSKEPIGLAICSQHLHNTAFLPKKEVTCFFWTKLDTSSKNNWLPHQYLSRSGNPGVKHFYTSQHATDAASSRQSLVLFPSVYGAQRENELGVF
jgi:hypothetical protein